MIDNGAAKARASAIGSGGPQRWTLRVGRILDHAARYHPARAIYSRGANGEIEISNWRSVRDNALRFSRSLLRLGARPGDRVGVMAWNTVRHLEAWYGVPGAGCVTHSLNPRLFEDQLAYIVNHAEDRWIVFDADLTPLMERLSPRLTTVEGYVAIGGDAGEAASSLPNAMRFEDLTAGSADGCQWVDVDENAPAGLCYTSGTTGDPKGVLYTHRSHVLHAMAVIQPDVLGFSSRDIVLPVVPFFHANGWSTPFSAPMAGAGMVLPGRDLSPASLHEMIRCGATAALAVPTVWFDYLRWLRETDTRVTGLGRVVIGGSACPASVIEEFESRHGVRVVHAWGMTEMSPLGTLGTEKPEVEALAPEDRRQTQLRCGHPFFTVDLDLRSPDGSEAEWDGESAGNLRVRGPAVVQRYYGQDEDTADHEGWFDTGDIATIDQHAYLKISDRAKDLIKSGGEWISSIDLENTAVGHPDVAEAAAVAKPDERWGERPVLFVGCETGRTLGRASGPLRRSGDRRRDRSGRGSQVARGPAAALASAGRRDSCGEPSLYGDPQDREEQAPPAARERERPRLSDLRSSPLACAVGNPRVQRQA